VKTVILAGGRGTRISEETQLRPKPMVEIGGRPILWHIMKIYSAFNVTDFIICLGYKGYMIKDYFINYMAHNSNLTVDLQNSRIEYHSNWAEPWRITLVETGENTQTGGRLKRLKRYLQDEEAFCMTYGDGLADINIDALLKFHRKQAKLSTVSVVRPPSRFGAVVLNGDRAERFAEKPDEDGGLINGGFFVLSPKVLDYIEGDDSVWEREPLERLAAAGELAAYRHHGFWQPMDTLREKELLEASWASGRPAWRVWENVEEAAQ
jgi:glucose-1-phosphate cytidylyltransferase